MSSRLYFGTDTRAQDVLLGAAIGILLRAKAPATGRRSRAGFSWLALMAVAIFVWDWTRIDGTNAFSYRGGFLLADAMVALVIVSVTMAPGALPARLLSFAPLRFIGWISYGIYLWHWPVFLVLDHARTGLDGWSLFGLRCLVTLAIAMLSWSYVEVPIRRMEFGTWRSRVLFPIGAAAVVGVLVGTTFGSQPTLLTSASASASASATANVGVGANADGTGPATLVQRNAFKVVSFPKQDHRHKLLFVGDSLSLFVGYDLAPYAAHYDLTIGGRAQSGCGLATAVPYNLHGTVTYPLAPCATWRAQYQSDVDQLHPEVAVVVLGWWEQLDRMYQGRWQHLGDPEFDAYEKANFEDAVRILHSHGARVVLMTAPYFDTGEQPDGQPWDEDSPGRTRALNSIIQAVARQHPHIVSVVPLNRYLDPDGHFTWTIHGRQVRLADGSTPRPMPARSWPRGSFPGWRLRPRRPGQPERRRPV